MGRFFVGTDRDQATLFQPCLEDRIAGDNPVRVIDAFVDALDLASLGFEGVEAGFLMPSDAYPGDRSCLPGTEDDLQDNRLFRVATSEQVHGLGDAWFGEAVPGIENRLVPFARTGGDGSHAAFWLDDGGSQQIVHLGSEGLVCLLGRTPPDFLRFLAIGSEEIGGECLDEPNAPPRKAGLNASLP